MDHAASALCNGDRAAPGAIHARRSGGRWRKRIGKFHESTVKRDQLLLSGIIADYISIKYSVAVYVLVSIVKPGNECD